MRIFCFIFTNNIPSCVDIHAFIVNMVSKIYQTSQSGHKYGNEIFFVCLFILVITVNKFVLSELKFTVPTVFQGWQTLSCVILLSILIKFKKITNDLQILDVKALSLLLPALICFAFGIVAGSKALASLPVPVFLAVTNLYPALISIIQQIHEINNNIIFLKVGGISSAILGTVIIILMYSKTSQTDSPIIWLFVYIFLNFIYYLYLNKLNLDLTNTTQIYYRNFFSVIVLLPISIYLDVLHLPSGDWQFYSGCFLSGVLGTLLQIWTFKINSNTNYLQFESLAKIISSLVAYKLFFANIEPFVWFFIIINFLICAFFVKNKKKEPVNVKSDIYKSLPPSYGRKIELDGVYLV